MVRAVSSTFATGTNPLLIEDMIAKNVKIPTFTYISNRGRPGETTGTAGEICDSPFRPIDKFVTTPTTRVNTPMTRVPLRFQVVFVEKKKMMSTSGS